MNDYIGNPWNLIFAQQDPMGKIVNLTILTLFAAGLLDVARSLWRLASEHRLIKKANSVLSQPGSRPPYKPAAEVLRFLGIVDEDSLLGRRVARVINLREAGLGHRDVLQQLTVERVDGYGSLARYIGMILTLLGLLGTVFGLSQALFKIQGALGGVKDVEGFRQLTEALGGTLGGMKTAFGCTLAGLLCALLISAANHLVRRVQSRLIAELEEFVICNLLPELESVDPDADNTATAFANVISKAAVDLDNTRKDVSSAAARYEKSSAEMAAATVTLEASVKLFSEGVAQVTGNQHAFIQALGETRSALTTISGAITKQCEDVRAFTASSTETLEKRLAAIAEGARDNRILQESIQTLVKSFQPAIDGYHAQFKESAAGMFVEFKDSLNQLLVDVSQHYKDAVVGHIVKSQENSERTLAAHLKELRGLTEQNQHAVADAAAQSQRGMSESISRGNQELSKLFDEQNAALRAFSDMVVDVNFKMESLFDRVITTDRPGDATLKM